MKNSSMFVIVLLIVILTGTGCSPSAPTVSTLPMATQVNSEPSMIPTQAIGTATHTAIPVSSPTSTPPPLQLEIVQSQTWTDGDGNFRVNVLMRNPYEFAVAPTFRANSELLDSAGKMVRFQELYFLDGISGGTGFLLPGETIAANACFTCEKAPLTEAWSSIKFESVIADASGKWEYYNDVESTITSVSFHGDSPIFDVTGTVKNNTDTKLDRISTRIFVFDQDGNLAGAAEVSGWDVGPGATVNINGYGIGQSPDGGIKYEVTALGVKY